MLAGRVILTGIGLHAFRFGEGEGSLGIPGVLMVESISCLRFELGDEALRPGEGEELFGGRIVERVVALLLYA